MPRYNFNFPRALSDNNRTVQPISSQCQLGESFRGTAIRDASASSAQSVVGGPSFSIELDGLSDTNHGNGCSCSVAQRGAPSPFPRASSRSLELRINSETSTVTVESIVSHQFASLPL
jgi:hypothetical protein